MSKMSRKIDEAMSCLFIADFEVDGTMPHLGIQHLGGDFICEGMYAQFGNNVHLICVHICCWVQG